MSAFFSISVREAEIVLAKTGNGLVYFDVSHGWISHDSWKVCWFFFFWYRWRFSKVVMIHDAPLEEKKFDTG